MPPLTGDPKSHDISEFKDGMTGTCLCGSIKVTIRDQNLFGEPRLLMCHCNNCRHTSGNPVAANLILDEDQVTFEEGCKSDKKGEGEGKLRTFPDYETGSGEPVMRAFCDRCGNPIRSTSKNFPGKVILKPGIFPRIPAPAMEAFAAHRQDWEKGFGPDVTAFKIAPGGDKLDE